MKTRLAWLVAACSLGCTPAVVYLSGDANTPGDTAASSDRGAPTDAGAATDMGASIDAGAPTDTGASIDAGAPTDTGASIDAGAPTDTGSRVDAGVAVDRPAATTTRDLVRPDAPADSPARFGGAEEAAAAPVIVYPETETVIPPNLPSFEVHFRPASTHDLFEVSFAGSATVVRVYTRCASVGGGCALTLSPADLALLADAARGSGRVTVTVRGTRSPDGATGGAAVGRSAPVTLGVTPDPLRGTVYWATAAGSIFRDDMRTPEVRPELFLRGELATCTGCHVLSRDGTRMWAGRGIPGAFPSPMIDVASRTPSGASFTASFGTFSPDNRYFVASNGTQLRLLDGATGAAAAGLPSDFAGSMPDWSPDGARVVFARPRTASSASVTGHSGAADLMLLPWSGTAFGAATTLLASADVNQYYPSFSPDNRWVLFNRASGDSYSNLGAQLWVTSAAGGEPLRLARADGTGANGDSWPAWVPYVDRAGTGADDALLWFTFTSRRDYGLRLQQRERPAGERTTQLWMSAFRPSARGGDPSTAAFWLPNQLVDQGNHMAHWAPSPP